MCPQRRWLVRFDDDTNPLTSFDRGDDRELLFIRQQILPDRGIESSWRLDAAPQVQTIVTAWQTNKRIGSRAKLVDRPLLSRDQLVGKMKSTGSGKVQARQLRSFGP